MISQKRITLYKTLTWRAIASTTTILLAWTITGELKTGLALGGVDAVLKMVFYYMHEKAWLKFVK